ncbi:MAG: hypothetical protein LBD67_10745 [Candidatus Accumulibacter sp.]|jgi:hypothetical protein|nr:hypothetical protein [Accumulibacter sp.]
MDENDLQTIDPRRRIRELLAIPERDRTDAEWDELNELEIRTAPGNREKSFPEWRTAMQGPRRFQGAKNTEGRLLPQEGRARPESRLLKRQHRRPKRLTEPAGDV